MAVDMFIKVGDFKGESNDKKHAEWIDVLAWSWGLSNSGTTHQGGGGGGGKANVQDLSFTQRSQYTDCKGTGAHSASGKRDAKGLAC